MRSLTLVRDALVALGFRVLRFSWEDIRYRPEHVVGTMHAVLASRAA